MQWLRFKAPPRPPRRSSASRISAASLAGLMLTLTALTLIGLTVSSMAILLAPPLVSKTVMASPQVPTVPVPAVSIARENQLAGTPDWTYSNGADRTLLQGYAGVFSALPGQVVPVYVSAMRPVTYRVQLFRLGWYGGTGGRLMATLGQYASQAQGYWTPTGGLVSCVTCRLDSKTNLLDAQWAKSFEVPIAVGWPSGLYAIKLSAPLAQAETLIPLIVRDDSGHASIMANLPVFTYQAYNAWGGYNLYGMGEEGHHNSHIKHATRVSFNRPLVADGLVGAGDWLSWDIHTVRWLERAGVAVSYTTDVDLTQQPTSWLAHRSVLVLGHDEYWTKAMRDGAEAARAAGVNLGFLGANDAYWQARLEPDLAGQPDRTLTCYKVQSASGGSPATLAHDPLYPAHPELVTAQWRDSVVSRPENSLMGIMYESYIHSGYHPTWVVSGSSSDPFLRQAGLTTGQAIGGGLLGYEYDGIYANGYTPAGLVVLANSPIRNVYGVWQIANTTYYRAPSGALVFAAGSIWWAWGLDEMTVVGAPSTNTLHGNQQISDLLVAFLRAMDPAMPITAPQLAQQRSTASSLAGNSALARMAKFGGDWHCACFHHSYP